MNPERSVQSAIRPTCPELRRMYGSPLTEIGLIGNAISSVDVRLTLCPETCSGPSIEKVSVFGFTIPFFRVEVCSKPQETTPPGLEA